MSIADPAGENPIVDRAEVEKFERVAGEWWDADGKFRPLHQLNPVRLAYIRDHVAERFTRDVKASRTFSGLRVVDIGCGGGLLAEPMARLGADVTGVDPSITNIAVARRHAEQAGLAIDYRDTTAEALAATDEGFDVVLAMEVIEHVPDLNSFLAACAALLKPDGLLFLATINRTPKAFALAIVGAEYLLRWLPRGTHQYSQLVQPRELEETLGAAGLAVLNRCGVSYRPLSDQWVRSTDMDVNYMMVARKESA
jgi:2-polyprenyl-6-hydroxyphenyl methylase/3-demethylubiquinone-9 3-methyltransferase